MALSVDNAITFLTPARSGALITFSVAVHVGLDALEWVVFRQRYDLQRCRVHNHIHTAHAEFKSVFVAHIADKEA